MTARWTDKQRSDIRAMRDRGMTIAAIGLFFSRSATAVREQLRERLAVKPTPSREIERCCLKCKRTFFASSPFIRLCDWCKKLPIFSS